MAQKRMSHVTALVADLVTQEEAVSKANMDGMFTVSDRDHGAVLQDRACTSGCAASP